MVRFVMFLLLAGLAWLGVQWWQGPEVQAEGSTEEILEITAGAEASLGAAATDPVVGGAAKVKEPVAEVPQATAPLQEMLARLRQGDEAALGSAFAVLSRSEGKVRQQMASVLNELADVAEGAPAMLRLLGVKNAFLHSAEGRQVARKALARVVELPPEQAVDLSSALLEKCMRGRIRKGDSQAKTLVDEIYAQHKSLVTRVLFNPSRLNGARSHKVQSGEVLDLIARKYRQQGLHIEGLTLAMVNRISNPRSMRVGQVLKVPVEEFSATLHKQSFLLAMHMGKHIVRLYWVGHGKDDCTPETVFTISEKQAQPDWYMDGRRIPYGHPENVLGEYFVKFVHESFTGFGAHGTASPETIGTMASMGCIRMLDPDIEEFFRVMPRGCKLQVVSQ